MSRKNSSYTKRSAGRLAAVQTLYQIEVGGGEVETAVSEFGQYYCGHNMEEAQPIKADMAFVSALVTGVHAHKAQLDALIQLHLTKGWVPQRLEKVMLQILRSGCFELLYKPDLKTAVIISEYVDIGAAFFDKKETNFLHALLDKIAKGIEGRQDP